MGAPSPYGFSCGENFGQTCYGGTLQPNVNISWKLDGSTVASSSDQVDYQDYDCAVDDSGHAMSCSNAYDESTYSSLLTVGTHTVQASISSSDDSYAAFSTTWNITVTGTGPVPTSTEVSASTTSASYGTPVAITATVTSSGVHTPTGAVNFYDGTTVIAGGTLYGGVAKASVNNLAAGSHTISAKYFGDGDSLPNTGSMASAITTLTGPPQLYLKVTPQITTPGNATTVDAQLTISSTSIPQGYVSCVSGSSTSGPVAVDNYGRATAAFSSLPTGNNTITCSFTSSVDSGYNSATASAAVVPNGFATTGSLNTARGDASMTLLSTGKVLVAGGRAAGQYINNPLSSSELFDPITATFAGTANLLSARYYHTATLLQDGTVLIAGGENSNSYLSAAEFYDPETSSFHTTGSLGVARCHHTATLLSNGKVLIAGGKNTNNNTVASAELYDPLTGLFSPTGSMLHARAAHMAVSLSDGRVLISGGEDDSTSGLNTAEIYDPNAGTFTATGNLISGREQTTAILLSNGKVLVAGGMAGSTFSALSSAETFDSASGTFSSTGGMQATRRQPLVVALKDGTVLFAGGTTNQLSSVTSAEIYTPANGTFASAGSLSTGRFQGSAALLNDSEVLIAGGETNPEPTAEAELFTYQLDSGALKPKFQVVGVTYAPPGSGSKVTYSSNLMLTDTSSIDNTFTNATTVGVKLTADGVLGPFKAGSTATSTSGYKYTTDSVNSLTLTRSQGNSLTVAGPLNSGIGVDHDYDLIYVWLNPVVDLSIPNISNTVLWTGYSYDQADTNSIGNPDIIGVPVLCFKNPYLYPSCQQWQVFFKRSWDTSAVGGLTLADYAAILTADPFVQDPNFNPQSDPTQRFTVQTGTITYPVPAPGQGSQQTTSQLSISDATSTTNTSSNEYSVGFALEAKIGFQFIAKVSTTLAASNTTTWKNQSSKTQAATSGTQSTYTITTPSASDNYTGPVTFNAWLDNVYQTFMFFSPNRSQVPATTIGTNSSSLSFGTVTVGQTSSSQTITVTNNSTSSLSFDPNKAAAISFSLSSYILQSDSCTSATVPTNGTCSVTVVFAPNALDAASTGLTSLPATMIIAGIELAPGSTNVMRTAQVALSGTASR